MLQNLAIHNFALIDDLNVDLTTGLTVITGETGAGKSILLGALGLLMGDRADTKVMSNAEEKCIIEGDFNISEYGLQSLFEENDWDYDDHCLLRREISTSGKSRAFINDSPCNLQDLKLLSDRLLDVFNQFDTLEITSEEYQTKAIDAYANNEELQTKYASLYSEYVSTTAELNRLEEMEKQSQEKVDFLSFQLNEIEELGIQGEEEIELQSILNRAKNSESLVQNLQSLDYLTKSGENTIDQSLALIIKELSQLEMEDPALQAIIDRLQEVRVELDDIASEAVSYSESVSDLDVNISEIETRLDKIFRLLQKHHVENSSNLLDKQNEMQVELDSITGLSSQISGLRQKIHTLEEQMTKVCSSISEARHKNKEKLEKEVLEGLTKLNMGHSRFEVALTALERFTARGNERVEFLFSANPGFEVQPLKKVASGGEMSRLALVIQSIIADYISLPTMIFDEIDSGVSGNVAAKMGDILHDTAKNHQLIVITHSPQIAALGDNHFHVVKEVENKITTTQMIKLSDKERVQQIAVLLSTDPPTESAIQNAKELLQRG